eukprot:2297238-Rhodomonas_salina.1
MTRAISQSQRMLSSIAFLTNPFFRFANVACLLRSSLMRAILIFFLPISEPTLPTLSQRSSFLEANLSASLALELCAADWDVVASVETSEKQLLFTGNAVCTATIRRLSLVFPTARGLER